MRPDFLTLLSKTDPKDAAPYLSDIVTDLTAVMSFAATYASDGDLRNSCNDVNIMSALTSVLFIAEGISRAIAEGADELARECGRSYWAPSGGGTGGLKDVA